MVGRWKSWGFYMLNSPKTNQRKARCADCKRLLQKGEGIGHKYPMFSGGGEYYYLCPGCDRKRKEKEGKA